MIVEGWVNKGEKKGKGYKKHGGIGITYEYIQGIFKRLQKADKIGF